MIFIYITCANKEEAEKIADALLEKRVGGCANIWPIHSKYLDNGNIKEGEEHVLLLKTIESKVQEVDDIVRSLHSYKIPCIATFALHRLNRDYKEWLASSIS